VGSAGVHAGDLQERLEHDLARTWDAWSRVLDHPGIEAHDGLNARLVPPRVLSR
jgi:hypothetical protein